MARRRALRFSNCRRKILTSNNDNCVLCRATNMGLPGRSFRHAYYDCPVFSEQRRVRDARLSEILQRALPTTATIMKVAEFYMCADSLKILWLHLPHMTIHKSAECDPHLLIADTGVVVPKRLLDGWANNVVEFTHKGLTQHLQHLTDSQSRHAAINILQSAEWAHTVGHAVRHCIERDVGCSGRQLSPHLLEWLKSVFKIDQQFNTPPLFCTTGVFGQRIQL
jgi:hypothetical protein